MRVTFWGVRGSHPVPGLHTAKIGGNTSCVEIQANGNTIIIDSGTGIIPLGRDLARRQKESNKKGGAGQPIRAVLLISHTHHDHIEGFAFFEPAYIGTSRLHIYGPRAFSTELKEILHQNLLPPYCPVTLDDMYSAKSIQDLMESDEVVLREGAAGPIVGHVYQAPVEKQRNDVVIRVHKCYAHPHEGVFCYSIEAGGKRMIYASDVEGYIGSDQRLVQFARGADLLIHDAQYTEEVYLGGNSGARVRQGWGHSTVNMAAATAKAAEVKQLALFHHDPEDDDANVLKKEKIAKKIFPNSISAYEGLTLQV
ncbi:MAG: MBL fold metallo-hydrolase [bacterium]